MDSFAGPEFTPTGAMFFLKNEMHKFLKNVENYVDNASASKYTIIVCTRMHFFRVRQIIINISVTRKR